MKRLIFVSFLFVVALSFTQTVAAAEKAAAVKADSVYACYTALDSAPLSRSYELLSKSRVVLYPEAATLALLDRSLSPTDKVLSTSASVYFYRQGKVDFLTLKTPVPNTRTNEASQTLKVVQGKGAAIDGTFFLDANTVVFSAATSRKDKQLAARDLPTISPDRLVKRQDHVYKMLQHISKTPTKPMVVDGQKIPPKTLETVKRQRLAQKHWASLSQFIGENLQQIFTRMQQNYQKEAKLDREAEKRKYRIKINMPLAKMGKLRNEAFYRDRLQELNDFGTAAYFSAFDAALATCESIDNNLIASTAVKEKLQRTRAFFAQQTKSESKKSNS